MKKLLSVLVFVSFLFSSPIGYMGSLFSEWFDIIKKDNLVYGATSSGIEIMKINASKLSLLTKYDVGENIYKIILYKNYIVGMGNSNVYLFKLEKNKIQFLQEYPVKETINDIVNKDNIFYVLVYSYTKKSPILKLENDKFTQVNSIKAEIYYRGLVNNNYLILSNYAGGYYIYDITDPINPVLLKEKSIADGGAYSMFLKNNLLYTGNIGGITVYNFPSLDVNFSIGEGVLPLSFYKLIVKNNYILGVDGETSNRFGMINLNDLNTSKPDIKYYEIGYDSRVKPYSMYDDNNSLYVCADDGVKKVDLNDYKDINITTLYEIPIVKGLIINGDYFYVKTPKYVGIYKKNENNLTLITKIIDKKEYGSINNILIYNNYLYIIYSYAFSVYDITNPSKPLFISAYEPKDNNGKLITSRGDFFGGQIVNNKLFLSKNGDIDILNVFDVSNPKNITLLGKFTKNWGVNGFKIVGNYAYLILNNRYIGILDISNPSSINYTGSYVDTQGTIHSVLVDNNKMFVATWDNILVYDIETDGSLKLTHSYNIDSVFSMKIKGNYLFASGGSGLHILNIKDLDRVYDVAKENNYNGSIVIDNNKIYLIKSVYHGRGIDIIDIDDLIQKQKITFNKGWNLKASPVYKEINVTDLGCEIYWKWDNVDKNWNYYSSIQTYDNLLKNKYKKFNLIYPSEGFWAYCKDSHTLELQGVSYNTFIGNLTSGWNLIGVGKDENISDLNLKENGVLILWTYKNNKWKYWVDDKNLSMLDENYTISKDDGVWIYKN